MLAQRSLKPASIKLTRALGGYQWRKRLIDHYLWVSFRQTCLTSPLDAQ